MVLAGYAAIGKQLRRPSRAAARLTDRGARIVAAGVLVFALALGDLSTAQVLLPPTLYTLGLVSSPTRSGRGSPVPVAGLTFAPGRIAPSQLRRRYSTWPDQDGREGRTAAKTWL